MGDERLDRAIGAIDAVNSGDPHLVEVDGVQVPKELAHARLAHAWVLRLDPHPTELQLIAARAHHLRRWEIDRSSYEEGRGGYLRWRATLKKRHAEWVAEILMDVGYDADEIARVGQIIRKEGLGRDPQVQTHEDALCLVFLQTQLGDVAAQLGEDKTIGVLRKTLKKMSPAGITAALEVPMGDDERALLLRAAAGEPSAERA